MPDETDVPDLSKLDEGRDVRVTYRSQRSGNEVSRKGTVQTIHEADEGDQPIVYVHTDNPEPLKHVYCSLTPATLTGGDPAVAAVSVTTEPDVEADGPLEPGRFYTFTQHVTRRQILGVVDTVVPLTGRGRPLHTGAI